MEFIPITINYLVPVFVFYTYFHAWVSIKRERLIAGTNEMWGNSFEEI